MKAALIIRSIDINLIWCGFSDVYEPDLVTAIAQKIIESGGLVRPLVVTSIKDGKYDLEEGVLEYYAALKAYSVSPRMLNVNCVVTNKAAILPVFNQLQLLNSQQVK